MLVHSPTFSLLYLYTFVETYSLITKRLLITPINCLFCTTLRPAKNLWEVSHHESLHRCTCFGIRIGFSTSHLVSVSLLRRGATAFMCVVHSFPCLTSASINGSFVCSQSDARYCAGDSLATNIIIRCSGTTGQPGNCNDKFVRKSRQSDYQADF